MAVTSEQYEALRAEYADALATASAQIEERRQYLDHEYQRHADTRAALDECRAECERLRADRDRLVLVAKAACDVMQREIPWNAEKVLRDAIAESEGTK